MNAFHIKLLAVGTMVVDHIGLFFFPQYFIFRIIGRLAFPLFCWLIANGAHHTKDINAYLKRIIILALISQFPFILANKLVTPSFSALNVLFTLFFGLLAIKAIQTTKNIYVRICISLLCMVFAQVLQAEYGAQGVASIIGFYVFYTDFPKLVVSQVIIALFPPVFDYWYQISLGIMTFPYLRYVNTLGLLSLLCIALYNRKGGKKTKYLFYIFYPLQYILILLFLVSF